MTPYYEDGHVTLLLGDVREVPEGCGLVEVHAGISTVVVTAPRREIPPPGWEFLAAVGRRGFRLVRELPEVGR